MPALSPSEYRPHGASVVGLYAPLRQGPVSFGSVYIHARVAQHIESNLHVWLSRVYTSITHGYDDTEGAVQERSYHGLFGLNLGQGLTQIYESTLDPEPAAGFELFPISDDDGGPDYVGRALIGFFYEAEDKTAQTWKCVVRSILGTTIVDTGIVYEADSWYEMRIERNAVTGNLHFYIRKGLDAETEKVILSTDEHIPLRDMNDEDMLLGKIHYVTPATLHDDDETSNYAYLEYVDYDTSKFVYSHSTPIYENPELLQILMDVVSNATNDGDVSFDSEGDKGDGEHVDVPAGDYLISPDNIPDGYRFFAWTVDGIGNKFASSGGQVSIANSDTLHAAEAGTLQMTLVPRELQINFALGTNPAHDGEITADGDDYEDGEHHDFVDSRVDGDYDIEPGTIPDGYIFDHWVITGADNTIAADHTEATTMHVESAGTLTMTCVPTFDIAMVVSSNPAHDGSLNFDFDNYLNGGEATTPAGPFTVSVGAGTPANYVFGSWVVTGASNVFTSTGTNTSTTATDTLTIASAGTLTLNLVPDQINLFRINIAVNSNTGHTGDVTLEALGPYTDGQYADLTSAGSPYTTTGANFEVGDAFVSWAITGAGNSVATQTNPAELTIAANGTLTLTTAPS